MSRPIARRLLARWFDPGRTPVDVYLDIDELGGVVRLAVRIERFVAPVERSRQLVDETVGVEVSDDEDFVTCA